MGCFFYFNSFTDERKREDFPKKQIQIQVRVYLSDALFYIKLFAQGNLCPVFVLNPQVRSLK